MSNGDDTRTSMREHGAVARPASIVQLETLLAELKAERIPPGVSVVGLILTTRPLTGLRGMCLRAAMDGIEKLGHRIVRGPDCPTYEAEVK